MSAPRLIDAHVHILPEHILGERYERLHTEQFAYGFRKTYDGSFYVTPPYVRDSQFTADTLVHMMDVYGVERAVVQQTPIFPFNEDVAQAVEKYPERLSGAMLLEPEDGWAERMEYWYGRGLRSVKFEMRSFTSAEMYPQAVFGSRVMGDMLEKAGALRMTVTVDPAPTDFPVYRPEALYDAVKAVPDARFVICHLGYPSPIDTEAGRRKWEAMVTVSSLPNCWLDVSAMPDFFDGEGWPFPTALALFRQVKDTMGIEKLVWGSDIPSTLCRATYPQMIEMFRRAGLTEAELDRLFYTNALAAYGLPAKEENKK